MNLSDINITLFAYFYKKTDFDFESEAYDEDVIFCVAEGKFSYWINDGQKHIAEKGDAIICPKGTVLGRKMNSPTTFCMIKFKQFETLTYKKILLPYDSFSRLLQNIKSISNYGICLDVSGNPILHHYCRDIF